MAIFVPFQHQTWALYLSACVGYSILVFGLRSVEKVAAHLTPEQAKPTSEILLTHSAFLIIVIGWVWSAMAIRPYLPYFLTTEDTSHPYFGLGFLGVLGLMGLELIEQRWLRAKHEINSLDSQNDFPLK